MFWGNDILINCWLIVGEGRRADGLIDQDMCVFFTYTGVGAINVCAALHSSCRLHCEHVAKKCTAPGTGFQLVPNTQGGLFSREMHGAGSLFLLL